MFETFQGLLLIATFAFGSVVIFLIFRKVFWWYWGVNKIIKNQEKTIWLLTNLYLQQGGKLDEADEKFLNS